MCQHSYLQFIYEQIEAQRGGLGLHIGSNKGLALESHRSSCPNYLWASSALLLGLEAWYGFWWSPLCFSLLKIQRNVRIQVKPHFDQIIYFLFLFLMSLLLLEKFLVTSFRWPISWYFPLTYPITCWLVNFISCKTWCSQVVQRSLKGPASMQILEDANHEITLSNYVISLCVLFV